MSLDSFASSGYQQGLPVSSSAAANLTMASSQLLKSLVVPPTSGQAPTATLIFAHGLGDTGLGWLDVAKMLSQRPALRHVRFVLPNAPVQPVTLNMGMAMPSWFDITSLEDMEEGEDEKGLQKSAGEIKKLVQAEIDGTADGLNGTRIAPERVVVGGFSQVSKHSLLRRWSGLLSSGSSSSAWQTNYPARRQAPSCATSRRVHLGSSAFGRTAVDATRKSHASILGNGVDLLYLPRLSEIFNRGRSARHLGKRILSRAELQALDAMLSDQADLQVIRLWLGVR